MYYYYTLRKRNNIYIYCVWYGPHRIDGFYSYDDDYICECNHESDASNITKLLNDALQCQVEYVGKHRG